ncbi:MAG: phage Gp37/Gp68 family protein [Chloroflexota bacterium]
MPSKIEWTDETWNPMTGCTKISAGCDHCYAHTVAHRRTREVYLRQLPVKDTAANREDPFAPRFWDDRLGLPRKWKEPRRVFVNSMSDVFHAHFSLEQIRRVFDVMNDCPQHQFQLLTKRPERAARYANKLTWGANIWMGVSIENMELAHRADALRQIPAEVRFISAEPLLGPLDKLNVAGIDWIIGGGESGADYRPVDIRWARGLRALCRRHRIKFFWKQWGGATSKSGGRELDGRVHSEYPVALAAAR